MPAHDRGAGPLEIGDPAPEFELPDLEGRQRRLAELRGRVAVVNFWSATCPHSARADQLIDELRQGWGERVAVWRIASNANESIEQLRAAVAERQVEPVLIDERQSVADAYGALTTPHIYLIDEQGRLRYAGAPDDVNLRVREPSENYLEAAVSAVLAGETPDPAQTSAFGCTLVRHPMADD